MSFSLKLNIPSSLNMKFPSPIQSPTLCINFEDDSDFDESESSLCDEIVENPEYCDKQGPARINEYIYLGSEAHASDFDVLRENGIGFVLNVASCCKNYFEGGELVYKNLPVLDVCETNISEIFNEAFDFIETVKQRNGKVLIHCQAGVSRSVTITTAYLMKTEKISMNDALKKVKETRKCAAPNFGFMVKLMEYEDGLSI
ncbi:Dual specificity protein phosphatase 2 [Oopsacas minuta]|uniref:protein-tyrosine-phosphatase n=1 Tax=Oopsacas minuta TaxID=111878 RepID=A0AAV7KKB3_9METZ|nr:Dual specificity protein phosphatase 2 [Oopsacas minuta]